MKIPAEISVTCNVSVARCGGVLARENAKSPWHGSGTPNFRLMAGTYPPRMLVIADDPSVGNVVRSLLQSYGFKCSSAGDGPSGMKRLEREQWDLVLIDLTRPGMTGWDVVNAIRHHESTLPVIVVTRVDDPAIRRQACESNAVTISKPFHVSALKAALVEALYAKSP